MTNSTGVPRLAGVPGKWDFQVLTPGTSQANGDKLVAPDPISSSTWTHGEITSLTSLKLVRCDRRTQLQSKG